jgi:enterochelin esterase-like enzyme
MPTLAPSLGRVEKFSFFSTALGRSMEMAVYVPPGYDTSGDRYPVLYMLHGQGWDDTINWEWETYGILDTAGTLMNAGAIQPFLVVLPQGERSYWVDHEGGPAWGRYLAVDVVSEVDSRYRTLSDRDNRAVGGLSMGADGAIQIAMNHPDVFGIAGVHSPVLRPWEIAPNFAVTREYFEANYPVAMVQVDPTTARSLTIELDVGDDDIWLAEVTAFHELLVRLGIEHTWNRWPGAHHGDYWGAHVPDYLHFYGDAFAGAE